MYTGGIASSPLSVGRNGGGAGGSSSFKRTVGRGAPSSYSRPATGSYSNTGTLHSAVEGGVLSASQLHKHFSLSLSSSTRRNVISSSPTQSEASEQKQAPAPSCITVGFAVHQDVAPALPAQPATPPNLPRPAKQGLLSRALTHDPCLPEQALPSLPESVAFYGAQAEGSAYFPDVDKTLLRDLQERHAVFHSELVTLAYMLAAKAHDGQLRKDGSSQLSHCVMTALQLAELGLDAETVSAGLLHEALRVNPAFRSQMEEFMPTAVIQLVDRVTTISEISQLYRNNKEALGEEKMTRMLLAMEDVKAMLVKLACRVHNMKTISALPREKQISLAQETLEIFSVVANRLGIWSLKAELEDLAFSVLHPEEYESLKAQVAKRQDPDALEATINQIKLSLDQANVQYEDISGRPKSLFGIWKKMRDGNITSLDKVYDVTALRVVVTNKHDCYRALRAVQAVYRCMPARSKDYIKDERKANGYQSLHETIYGEGNMPVEVQIRTHKMHYIAEYGFAAHWKYKEKLSNEDEWLDKEVQYKKWLTNYKLGLNDKKVRASGAPPRETALQSLGLHLLDGTSGVLPAGVDPFLQHDRFRLSAPPKQRVDVLVQTQDTIEAREFAHNFCASQLAVELQVDQLPGYVMTINQRVPADDYVLKNGDLVQVVALQSALARASSSLPAQPSNTRTIIFPGADTAVEVMMPAFSVPSRRAALPPLPEPSSLSLSTRASMHHPVVGLSRAQRRRSSDHLGVAVNGVTLPTTVCA